VSRCRRDGCIRPSFGPRRCGCTVPAVVGGRMTRSPRSWGFRRSRYAAGCCSPTSTQASGRACRARSATSCVGCGGRIGCCARRRDPAQGGGFLRQGERSTEMKFRAIAALKAQHSASRLCEVLGVSISPPTKAGCSWPQSSTQRSRQPIHVARLRHHASRLRPGREYGKPRRRLRQRARRELHVDHQDRAPKHAHLKDTRPGQARRLPLHQDVPQPPAPTLGAGHAQPRRVREDHQPGGHSRLKHERQQDRLKPRVAARATWRARRMPIGWPARIRN
jgi:hypothetical protein